MKIFQLNEYEWWFAKTLEAAYEEAERQTGITEAKQREDFGEPVEIKESEMEKTNQVHLEEDGQPKKMGSFREALELAMHDGRKSGLLCGSES